MEQKNTVDYKKLYEEILLKSDQQLIELGELKAFNQQLLHRLDLLLKSAYGSKSERFAAAQQNPGQMRLELQQEVLVEQTTATKPQQPVSKGKKSQKKSPDIS